MRFDPATGSFIFYTITIALAGGIFVRSFVPIGLTYITLGAVVAFGLSLIGCRDRSARSAPLVMLIALAFFAASVGALRMEWASWSETDPHLEPYVLREVTLHGVIVREPDVRESTTHLTVAVGDARVLAITDPYGAYQYGDRIQVTGELLKPETFTTDFGRTFNYPGYLHARGIAYTMRFGDITLLSEGHGNPFLAALYRFKHAFMRNVEALIPEPAAGLSEGLLLGEKRALGAELETVFRSTGIIHVVVLSGYNIMLVVGFVLYLLSFLCGLRLRALFGIAAIIAFALLVGLSATVVRASIMAGLLLASRAFGETYAVMRALMAAGVLMSLHNPYLLAFDTGFQLSFLATMGLVLLAPAIEKRIARIPNHPLLCVREFLTATIATQLFVLPFLLYQIGELSVVAIVVNVLVLPMVPVAMLLTFVAGMISFLSPIAAAIPAYLAYLALSYMLVVATGFASLPFAAFVVPPFPFLAVAVAYAAMAYLFVRFSAAKNTSPRTLGYGETTVDVR